MPDNYISNSSKWFVVDESSDMIWADENVRKQYYDAMFRAGNCLGSPVGMIVHSVLVGRSEDAHKDD